jgi:flavin reductase (DIM6/NTAB) family NADH-FMN oxidoreductase RutF
VAGVQGKALPYTHRAARARRVAGIFGHILSVDLAVKADWIDNLSGRGTYKFEAFGVTQMAASCAAAPLIGECFTNLECKSVASGFVNKYNLFILEVA